MFQIIFNELSAAEMSALPKMLQLDLLAELNHVYQEKRQNDALLEARVQNFELAYRMQMDAADAFDISIRREPVDIAALVNEVADANQPLAVNKQQTITVSALPNFVTMCDADRMREAIDNLVSNAIKYSPIGGKIAVVVGREQTNTTIRITDEGAGLSPEDLGRLFGRFQRLSAKPTGGESSTGLGLSIVKRIIDMHGGQVTARSAGPGKGSTFTVILPATEMS
jgi:signal transduction histidine kinase